MAELKTHEQVKELLDKHGLSVLVDIDHGYDTRDFFPDRVYYRIQKDNEPVFSYKCRTVEGREGDKSNGEQEAAALKRCLDLGSEQRYREQAELFKRSLKQLMELKRDHKFSKFGEKKELKDMCEKLSEFRYSGSYPTGSPEYSINIPLLEDNRELFEQLVKTLEDLSKTIVAEKELEDLQPHS